MVSRASSNDAFMTEWHRVVQTRDLDALLNLLAADISMGAPPYWDKVQGRPTVHFLLGLIILAIEGFTYHREWHDDSRRKGEIALEFRGRVGDLDLQGIDLITLNDRGEIQNLDVLIRPMNALAELRKVIAPQMIEFLGSLSK